MNPRDFGWVNLVEAMSSKFSEKQRQKIRKKEIEEDIVISSSFVYMHMGAGWFYVNLTQAIII